MKILIFTSICLSYSVIAQDAENILVNDSRIDTLTIIKLKSIL